MELVNMAAANSLFHNSLLAAEHFSPIKNVQSVQKCPLVPREVHTRVCVWGGAGGGLRNFTTFTQTPTQKVVRETPWQKGL